MTIILVLVLTFMINFIGSAALSVRIVGIRTGKMAASYAVYNIVFLLARFASTLQAPLLANTIEKSIIVGAEPDNFLFFKICFVGFLGSIVGGLFIPSMQRFMSKAVEKAYQKDSVLTLLLNSLHKKTFIHFIESVKVPDKANLTQLRRLDDMPLGMIMINMIVSMLMTISVLSCLYAGYLNPNLRATTLSLNGFIVGLSTILFMIVVEPHLGITADKVINGVYSESYFRRYLILVVLARIIGTGLSVFLLIPLAYFVEFLASSLFS